MSILSLLEVSKLMEQCKSNTIKDSWRVVFRELRSRRDEQTALSFVQKHGKDSVCKTCGTIDFPIVKIVQKASNNKQFHVGGYCSHCGIWFGWLGYELRTKRG